MSTYKEIKGFKVQTLASDTAASLAATGSWASTSSLNAACREGGGSGGPTTAINVGGYPYPMTSEHWNGSTWATFANLGTPRGKNATAGSYTNAIAGNGSTPGTPGIGIINNVESWNGSSWSEIAEINSIRDSNAMSAGGTNTAVIYFGGNAPGGASVLNESWNGSAWTEVNDLNAARIALTGIGTQTAALAVGGSPDTANTELWNGSAWTEVNNMNTAGDYMGGSSGTQTSALVFGGDPGNTTKTESWDGTSWTEVNNLGTGRDSLKGAGSGSTSALAYGGYTSTDLANSEEWTVTPAADFQQINLGQVYYNSGSNAFKVTQQLAPAGTWSSGGDLNTARYRFGGAVNATQNAGLVFGGTGSPYGQTEEYNGTAWSEQNDLNSGRYASYGGAGTQIACVTAGGYYPAGSPQYATALSETYNGTSWTEGNDLNEGRIDTATFGTSTAAVLAGGGEASGGPNTVSSVEIYDGTSWTETTNLPTVTQEMGSLGVSTAGLVFGGSVDSPSTTKNTTVEWDGTSWTAGGTYPISVRYTTGFGSLTNGIAAGGYKYPTAYSAVCNVYNGTSWSEVAELTTARSGTSGNGTGAAGFVAGGEHSPGNVASTEEWTVPESNSTITVS